MARKTNIYRVIVRQTNGKLVFYEEGADSLDLVMRCAPGGLVRVEHIDKETGSILSVAYPEPTSVVQSPRSF